jgi:hypothetical protein
MHVFHTTDWLCNGEECSYLWSTNRIFICDFQAFCQRFLTAEPWVQSRASLYEIYNEKICNATSFSSCTLLFSSVSFDKSYKLIFILKPLSSEGEGGTWSGTLNKNCSFGCWGSLERKVISINVSFHRLILYVEGKPQGGVTVMVWVPYWTGSGHWLGLQMPNNIFLATTRKMWEIYFSSTAPLMQSLFKFNVKSRNLLHKTCYYLKIHTG